MKRKIACKEALNPEKQKTIQFMQRMNNIKYANEYTRKVKMKQTGCEGQVKPQLQTYEKCKDETDFVLVEKGNVESEREDAQTCPKEVSVL